MSEYIVVSVNKDGIGVLRGIIIQAIDNMEHIKKANPSFKIGHLRLIIDKSYNTPGPAIYPLSNEQQVEQSVKEIMENEVNDRHSLKVAYSDSKPDYLWAKRVSLGDNSGQ